MKKLSLKVFKQTISNNMPPDDLCVSHSIKKRQMITLNVMFPECKTQMTRNKSFPKIF